MGLTDREKKIIDEMERALASEDPRLAAALERNVRPRLLLNIAAILSGIALILAGVIANFAPLGVLGFLIALVGAVTVRLGKVELKAKAPKGARIQDRWDRRNQQ
jgi:Na+-transporting methylmalonyl-CoA/oxaloacetate decarboxylase gamma subunit